MSVIRSTRTYQQFIESTFLWLSSLPCTNITTFNLYWCKQNFRTCRSRTGSEEGDGRGVVVGMDWCIEWACLAPRGGNRGWATKGLNVGLAASMEEEGRRLGGGGKSFHWFLKSYALLAHERRNRDKVIEVVTETSTRELTASGQRWKHGGGGNGSTLQSWWGRREKLDKNRISIQLAWWLMRIIKLKT